MKSKTPLLGLLLTVTFTLSLFSCANDETAESTEYPGIIKTPDGYQARPTQSISAETFNHFFNEGGWSEHFRLYLYPDGKVVNREDLIGGPTTQMYFNINESSLYMVSFGNHSNTFQYTQHSYSYDEARNILTIDDPFTLLSITEMELRVAGPGGNGTLMYRVFEHVTDEEAQELVEKERKRYEHVVP